MTVRRRAGVVALITLVHAASARTSFGMGNERNERSEPPAHVDSAASHFRHGVALYKEGDYEGALVEFRRAQELTPNYRVLYDIGQSLYQLQRYADALNAFEDYLAQGGTQLSSARRAAVEADLRALRSRVGHLEIAVNVEGAEVRVDDQVVGTSPLAAPVLVSIGHRKITVVKAERVPVEKFVDIAMGDRAKVVFEISTSGAPLAAPPTTVKETPVSPPPREETSLSPPPPARPLDASPGASLVWVPWVTTGALAVATGVTGALALTSKASLSNDLATFPGEPSAISQDRSRANTFAIASDVLLAASAISLAVALYVTLHHPARIGVVGAVRVRLGVDGVLIQGSF